MRPVEAGGHFGEGGAGEEDFEGEAATDGDDEDEDEAFDEADAVAGEPKDEEGIEAGNEDTVEEGDVEEEIEGDGGAEDFGEVAGGDGEFAEDPERVIDERGIGFAAGLGEVASANEAEACAEGLQQQGHEVGHDEDPKQLVTKACAAFEVSSPVAGVHVADADEISGAGEGKKPTPESP